MPSSHAKLTALNLCQCTKGQSHLIDIGNVLYTSAKILRQMENLTLLLATLFVIGTNILIILS